SEPGVRTPEPRVRTPEPGVRVPEPGVRVPEPGVRVAVQTIGCRNIRPYARKAISRPSTTLMTTVPISRYLTCTPTNTRLSIARTAAAATVSPGCQWMAPGTISPATQ